MQLNLWVFQTCLNLPGILKLPIGMAILCQIQIQIPLQSWCSQEGDAEASCEPVGDENLYSTWTGTLFLTSVKISAWCTSLFSSLHAAPSKPCREWHGNDLFSYLNHHSTTGVKIGCYSSDATTPSITSWVPNSSQDSTQEPRNIVLHKDLRDSSI